MTVGFLGPRLKETKDVLYEGEVSEPVSTETANPSPLSDYGKTVSSASRQRYGDHDEPILKKKTLQYRVCQCVPLPGFWFQWLITAWTIRCLTYYR